MKQKLQSLSKRGRALVLLSFVLATLLAGFAFDLSQQRSAHAASIVSVGSGSYTTAAPADLTLPPNTIYRTSRVTGPMPTSDWWTSVAWTQPAFPIYPLPLALQTTTTGIGVDYPDLSAETAAVHAGYATDFTLGATTGTFPTPNPLVDGYSDWTVSLLWNNNAGGTMRVTAGQGSPYVYATFANENPQLTFSAAPTVWSGTASSSVLGVTINNHNYALFGPTGSTWSGLGTATLTNNLQGKSYFSLAALPDNTTATLQAYQAYAYSFITNTQVSWSYDQSGSKVHTTYTVTTQAQEGTQTGTILALFPNQWKVTDAFTPLSYTYHSIRGTMKTIKGSAFSTTLVYHGIISAFPDVGQYNQSTLLDDIETFYGQSRSPTVGDTYWGGKALLQAANVIPLAKQAGLTNAYSGLLAWLEGAMADHFTATDASGNPKTTDMFYYDPTWGTLIGDPASYGSDSDLNDHHFHYGYWIQAAAEIARVDPAWVSKYGGMVNLLVNDIADPSRTDSMFPFLREFSPYEGHSWASGSELASWGNNQESSSEAINAWAGLIQWGVATGNTQIRDLGIYLYTTETQAVEQYWFNVDHDNFAAGYGFDYTAQVWGGQIWNGTYFSADPQQIRGINLLPITSSSFYLADNTAYEQEFLAAMAKENNNSNTWTTWQDTFWEYQAMIDAPGAIQLFNAQPSYGPGASESKAYTYSMLYDLQTLGQVDAAVTANTPLYAVFNHSGTINHVVTNASNAAITATFSDGASFSVPAGQTSVNGTVVQPRSLPPANGLAINAGGGEDYPFMADNYFTGGATANTGNAIDVSGVSNPAPQYIYQSYRYGNFSYTVTGLTPNASYPIRLHFAEAYWTAAGQRLFNVSANGQAALTNYDIFASAGAEFKAVVAQFNATASSSGTITLQFTSVKDNAQVNGIEVLGASSTTPTPTPTPGITPTVGTTPTVTPTPSPTGSVQINAGGSAASPFVADTDFTGGSTVTSTNTISTSGVTNPAPQAVYQSNRYGTFSYAVPGLTAGASYTVRLHFAETYWTATGQRTFNVSINGQQVLTNFDIIATAGAANKATVQQFTATADSSGKITLQFTTVKDNAQVNGIEIIPVASTPTAQINAGGPAVAPFVADTDFTGGATACSTNTISTSGVTSPAPQAVYQCNRYGTFSYAIPGLTAGKTYTVRLHFAETYWTAAGQRTFNVSINGQQVLTNFDIIGSAGAANTATVQQFTATADSTGKITIQFTTVKDNAQVNGIEVM